MIMEDFNDFKSKEGVFMTYSIIVKKAYFELATEIMLHYQYEGEFTKPKTMTYCNMEGALLSGESSAYFWFIKKLQESGTRINIAEHFDVDDQSLNEMEEVVLNHNKLAENAIKEVHELVMRGDGAMDSISLLDGNELIRDVASSHSDGVFYWLYVAGNRNTAGYTYSGMVSDLITRDDGNNKITMHMVDWVNTLSPLKLLGTKYLKEWIKYNI